MVLRDYFPECVTFTPADVKVDPKTKTEFDERNVKFVLNELACFTVFSFFLSEGL